MGPLDVTQYRALHRHPFQDVYAWAGRFRTVRIGKGGSVFCYPENIRGEMTKLFATLRAADGFRGVRRAEFAERAAHFLAELNAVHPFREGNGRTQLALLTLLSDRAGHMLDLDRMQPAEMLDAMVRSFEGDEAPLRNLVFDLSAPGA
ncbi:Fic/DOC family protein [Rhodoplanes roseus]|uniref:Fic/DOC family protein n=1 Tax=Rhodoplanes roseus TaxID=29409 RepID=UPI00315D08AE